MVGIQCLPGGHPGGRGLQDMAGTEAEGLQGRLPSAATARGGPAPSRPTVRAQEMECRSRSLLQLESGGAVPGFSGGGGSGYECSSDRTRRGTEDVFGGGPGPGLPFGS